MKKNLLWLSLVFAVSTYAAVPAAVQEPLAPVALQPLQQQAQAANMTAQFLTRFHYKTMPLDDAMSKKIFDRYLKSLDPEKLFFVQADIDQFAYAQTKMDDAIITQDLTTPFAIFNLYERRTSERMKYARELLKEEFDFSRDENYQYVRENEPWSKNGAEINDLWRKRVKNDWLRLRLAGKEDKAIRATLEKRYDYSLTRMQKLKSEDVFQIFMNSYAMSVEPHTNYLGPKASEDFDISMKLSLVGIGAVLQEREELTTIRELTPGGPAALSGLLVPGDRIVGVGQGAKSTPVDVMGWRLDDVVALIRGAKDSVVLLDILPADAGPDAKHKLVTLVRNKITLDQQAAKKSIIKVKNGETERRIGVISLPTFYQDFEAKRKGDKDFKSATRDVSRLLAELKKEKVDGVIIDLRNNGGGSLSEAVELTSLFTGKGPVVQQRNSQGAIQIESDKTASIAWDGPMGVMINRSSASASEIFAAAIQDYGRGLIIGESSFGKGTVQTMVNLDQVAHSNKAKFGEIKMTVAQFFRVNGGTTQLRGVTPDIEFPSFSDPDSFGESSYDNALPWVKIKAAEYQTLGDLKDLLPLLQVRHEMRTAKDREFQFMEEDAIEFKVLRDKKSISLNEAARRTERDIQEKKTKDREKLRLKGKTEQESVAIKAALQDDGLQANERSLIFELAAEKARKDAKDVLLDEAANILGDEVDLINAHNKLALRAVSGMMRKSVNTGQ